MKLKESQQQSNRLSNEDLVPLGQEKRTWKAMNFASIWMGCIHNIPTYATVGGLIAIGTFALAGAGDHYYGITYPIWRSCLKRYHAGTKYGLPFPVIIRASYGIYGANIPALLRAFTAIMWLGIQTFAGSTALNILLLNMW
nr:cytosine permease [Bacillus subtilis]